MSPRVRTSSIVLVTALSVLAACRGPVAAPVRSSGPLDWTLGSWQGTRRDGESGMEARMSVRVEPILGGAGTIERLEVEQQPDPYRGFTVTLRDVDEDRWVMMYANAKHGHFVRYEGDVGDGRCTWRPSSREGPHDSRLVSERLAPDRWRRTMSVSEDGGRNWKVLWRDDLTASSSGER
jgi:hypothetical protein